MNKKSQVTIFVVIGLAVIALLALGLYANSRQGSRLTLNSKETAFSNAAKSTIQSYMDECNKRAYNDAKDSFGFSSATKADFETRMGQDIDLCASQLKAEYEMQGYTVTKGTAKATVEINPETVIASIDFTMRFAKEYSYIEYTGDVLTYPRVFVENLPGGFAERELIVTTDDNKASLVIPKGTKVTDFEGKPVEKIFVKELDKHEGTDGDVKDNNVVIGNTYFLITDGKNSHLSFSEPVEFSVITRTEDYADGEDGTKTRIAKWDENYGIWFMDDTTTTKIPEGFLHTATFTSASARAPVGGHALQENIEIPVSGTGGTGIVKGDLNFIAHKYKETTWSNYWQTTSGKITNIIDNAGWECTLGEKTKAFVGKVKISQDGEITSILTPLKNPATRKEDQCKFDFDVTATCTPKGLVCCCNMVTGGSYWKQECTSGLDACTTCKTPVTYQLTLPGYSTKKCAGGIIDASYVPPIPMYNNGDTVLSEQLGIEKDKPITLKMKFAACSQYDKCEGIAQITPKESGGSFATLTFNSVTVTNDENDAKATATNPKLVVPKGTIKVVPIELAKCGNEYIYYSKIIEAESTPISFENKEGEETLYAGVNFVQGNKVELFGECYICNAAATWEKYDCKKPVAVKSERWDTCNSDGYKCGDNVMYCNLMSSFMVDPEDTGGIVIMAKKGGSTTLAVVNDDQTTCSYYMCEEPGKWIVQSGHDTKCP